MDETPVNTTSTKTRNVEGAPLGSHNVFRFRWVREMMSKAKIRARFTKDPIIEQIEWRVRIDHGSDVNKAAAEYFRDLPGEWQRYKTKSLA